MDCPRCTAQLKKMPTGKRNKRAREKWKKKYAGGVDTKIFGDTRPSTIEGQGQEPPDGMTVIDKCRSCGWTSTMVYNAGNRKWICKG